MFPKTSRGQVYAVGLCMAHDFSRPWGQPGPFANQFPTPFPTAKPAIVLSKGGFQMVCEAERTRPLTDVERALLAAIQRNILRGDYLRGNFRLESDHPDIDGTEFVIPPEVAAA